MKMALFKCSLALLILFGVCRTLFFTVVFASVNSYRQQDGLTTQKFDPADYQKISECGCQRRVFFSHRNISRSYRLNSTCSDTSSLFTEDQNVVSYTYFGTKADQKLLKKYRIKILQNIEQTRLYYPGYVVRVYSNSDLDAELCSIICENPDLQWCDIRKTPSHGDLSKMYFRTWRFLPLGDPTVNIFLSRDLDSIITDREQGAVLDWLANTTRPIQIMRDHHIFHRAVIMAGMWCASNSRLGEKKSQGLQKSIIDIAMTIVTKPKSFDQWLLSGVIWPHKDWIVAYDSYYCQTLGKQTMFRPYNVQRKNRRNDYVSMREGENWNFAPCPEKCRPSFGKNWTYC